MSSKGIPLEEDIYTEALSHVIERDFFPDLKVLKAESSFLDALTNQDPVQIRLAKERLENIHEPTSSFSPTLISSLNEDEDVLVNTNLTIDQFQTKYTSEDNASFHHLLDESNTKLLKKLAWMFKEEKKYQHTITDGSDLKKSAQVITWEHKGKNSLMFTPTLPSSESLDPSSSSSSSSLNAESFSSSLTSSSNMSVPTKQKGIHYHATRFHSPTPFNQFLTQSDALPLSSSSSSSSISSTTTTTTSSSSSFTHLLVPMTPLPSMDEAPPSLTWGSIEATPIQVKETPVRYQVPATPKRDELLSKLTTTTSTSTSSTPSSNPLTKKRKLLKLISGEDMMLRASYGKGNAFNESKTPSTHMTI